MNNRKEQIIECFYQIKSKGFVKSNRRNNTGIGKTFEDYLGIMENNRYESDLLGYEIKSHREDSNSYITLFTKSPNFPRRANGYLRDTYGVPYEEKNICLKKLHTSMFASKYNTFCGLYSFRLINDREHEVIRIGVYDPRNKELLDDSVGYTYSCIERILKKKLKDLFYVNAEREFRGEDEYFYFYKAEIYSNPSLERFLELIDNGIIMYDIRIGSYCSGKNYGKTHDHGSGFRIMEPNLRLLFEERTEVE